MKTMIKTVLPIAALSLLAGCAQHLSKEQCSSMNWYQIGYADGNQGQNQRDLSTDIADCAQYKIKVDQAGYVRGWKAGVRQYCQPQNAFLLGSKGSDYNHICPSDLAGKFDNSWRRGLKKYCNPQTAFSLGKAGQAVPAFCSPMSNGTKFRNAYAAGQRLYNSIQSTQAHINDINNQINDLNNQINAKQTDIQNAEKALGNKKTPRRAKKALSDSINSDYDAINDMKSKIKDLQNQIPPLQQQLTKEQNAN